MLACVFLRVFSCRAADRSAESSRLFATQRNSLPWGRWGPPPRALRVLGPGARNPPDAFEVSLWPAVRRVGQRGATRRGQLLTALGGGDRPLDERRVAGAPEKTRDAALPEKNSFFPFQMYFV